MTREYYGCYDIACVCGPPPDDLRQRGMSCGGVCNCSHKQLRRAVILLRRQCTEKDSELATLQRHVDSLDSKLSALVRALGFTELAPIDAMLATIALLRDEHDSLARGD